MSKPKRPLVVVTIKGPAVSYKSIIAGFVRDFVRHQKLPIDLEIVEVTPRKAKVKK